MRDASLLEHPSVRKGFTLLEMLVVVAIAGIALTMLSANLTLSSSQKLKEDAQRVARLFELAQEQIAITRKPIRFVATPERYYFSQLEKGRWQKIEHDDLFKEYKWRSPLDEVKLQIKGNNTALANRVENISETIIDFNEEPISVPLTLLLRQGDESVRIIGGQDQDYIVQVDND